MEPPAKRARLAYAPPDPFSLADGDEDEISMDPEEFAVKQDPNYWLDRSRAAADDKLQSAFESLFEKYSKDFGDTGDEINFYTDEIEVDNGHIASLPNADETNIGSLFGGNGGKKGEDEEGTEESEEERIFHGSGAGRQPSKALLPQQNAAAWPTRRRDHDNPYTSAVSPSKFGLLRQSPGHGGSFGSPFGGLCAAAGPPGFFSSPVHPAWVVPDIPEEAFSPSKSRVLQASNYRSTSLSPSWRAVRKALPAALTHGSGHASDDDDDLILGTTAMLTTPTKRRLFHSENTACKNILGTQGSDDKSPKRQPSPKQPTEDDQPSREDGPDQASPSKPNGGRDGAVEKTPKKQRRRTAKKNSIAAEQRPPEAEVDKTSVLVVDLLDKKETLSKELCGAETALSPATDRLPTPPVEDGSTDSILREPGIQNKTPKTVRFARNTVDPSYAFSDEEDGGLRKRVLPRKEDAVPKENCVPIVAEKEARQPDTIVIPDSPVPHEPERAEETSPRTHTNKRVEKSAASAAAIPTTSPTKLHTSPTKLCAPLPRTPQRKGPAPDFDPGSHHSSIVSLVSDESADEDELSLGPGDFTPRGVHRLHTHKNAVRVGRRSFRKAATVKRIKKTDGKTARLSSKSFSSPLLNRNSLRTAETFSPVGSPVKTPGGTIRRCGQDGFKCGRDFCFQCL